MKKSHRVALKPTPEQESLFLQHADYARFAYNWAVGEFQAGLQVGEWLSEKSLRPRWNCSRAHWGRESPAARASRGVPPEAEAGHPLPGSDGASTSRDSGPTTARIQ